MSREPNAISKTKNHRVPYDIIYVVFSVMSVTFLFAMHN